MKLVIDVSYYQNISPAQWDLLATVLDGVIIRLSFGTSLDSMADDHIIQANRVKLPYVGYHWVDPTKGMPQQQLKYLEAVKLFNPRGMYNDCEQYWTDWDAYMRQDLVEANRTKFSPQQLDAYYKAFSDFTIANSPVPVGNYSADWFINGYTPNSASWIKKSNYWDAKYLKYSDPLYIPSKEAIWGVPYDIKCVEEIAGYAMHNGTGIGLQFETFLKVKGLEAGLGYHLDWDVFSDEGFKTMFGGQMGKVLNVPFVSQLGEGAGMHNNDCGPASCSMVLLAVKDIYVQPDQWYEMDGWGAPALDTGTTAKQLQSALAIFELPSSVGTTLTIENIHTYINKGLPIIPLISYKVLSDAGITYYKGDFLHWFVIKGYDENNIIINDPYMPPNLSGTIVVSNQLFLNAYRMSYLVSAESTEGGVIPMTTNGVTTTSLNVRATPPVNGVVGNKIGGLPENTRVYINRSTITADNWGNVTYPIVGWVSMTYVTMDAVVIPPTVDEKAIRLDELDRMNAYIAGRKAEL